MITKKMAFGVLIMSIIAFAVSTQYFLNLEKLYSEVRLYFDFDRLSYYGSELSGSVTISLIGPGNISIYTFELDYVKGKVIRVNLERGIKAWKEFYANVLSVNGKTNVEGDIPLPSITVFMVLHDSYGNEYVASYAYSTFDYLKERYDDEEIIKIILSDPLIIFRAPLSITITPEKLGLRKVNFEDILGEDKGKENDDSTSACPTYFTEIFWDALYRSRNDLPNEWEKRILGYNLDKDMKFEVWSYYASNYSLAYYYKSNLYTALDALEAVKNKLGSEGIYTIESFLIHILRKSSIRDSIEGISWKTVYSPGTKFSVNEPIMSIEVDYLEEPIGFRMELEKSVHNQYRHGLTVFGTLALGASEAVTSYFSKVSYVRLNTSPKHYVFIPSTYRYSGDGVILIYDVSEVTYNGCKYWRVVPITTFFPIYLKVKQDWNNIFVAEGGLNEPDPNSFLEFVWEYNVKYVYSAYISNNNPTNIPFFQFHTFSSNSSEYFAGQQVNIVKNVFEYFLTSILSEDHPFLTQMMKIGGSLIGYTNLDMKSGGIILKLEGVRYGSVSSNVYVSVGIYTVKGLSDDSEELFPLVVKYRVKISH